MCAPRDPLTVMTSGGLLGAALRSTRTNEPRVGESSTGQVVRVDAHQAKFLGRQTRNHYTPPANQQNAIPNPSTSLGSRWAVLVHLANDRFNEQNAIPNPCASLEGVKLRRSAVHGG